MRNTSIFLTVFCGLGLVAGGFALADEAGQPAPSEQPEVQAPAANEPATPGVDAREQKQEGRIQEGVQSGQLTPGETRRLERGQEKVEVIEEKAKADGVVTPRERRRIQHQQNVQSRRIYRK